MQPNLFFKDFILGLPAGSILLPAEGEGRNAVFAAKEGWTVEAFDQSREGQKKALMLAEKYSVNINYLVAGYESVEYRPAQFDAIGFIYAHLPLSLQKEYYQRLLPFLKEGGYIVFEGFSKDQIEYQKKSESAGGPRDIDMLFSEQELKTIFHGMEIIQLKKSIVTLSEGTKHIGESSVIRMIARK